MKNTGLLLILVCLLISLGVRSQQYRPHLGLKEAIAASVNSNPSIKMSTLDVEIAKSKFRQADAIFLPQVNFSYAAFSTNDPLNSFGFKLQQGSIKNSDFDPHVLNNPTATSDFTTKIELQQPLINLDLIYQRKAMAKQLEMYQFVAVRTKTYLSFETEKVYLTLQLAYEQYRVLNEALTASKAVYKISQDYYNQGLIQKSDLLNANLYVLNFETQVNTSQFEIQDASDMLSKLMGKPTGVVYSVDSIEIKSSLIADSLSLPVERSDFMALEKGIEYWELMTESAKKSRLPKLNAIGSWQLHDKTAFGFGVNSYFAGMQLSWNIFNGKRTTNTISQQTFEKEKLAQQLAQEKDNAQQQINSARRQLSRAFFTIKQQQLAVDQASEALRVLQNRYKQGLVKTGEVLTAQSQLSMQQLGYTQAVFNHNLAAATLQFLITSK